LEGLEIVETRKVELENPIVVIGFPDEGLVGSIGVSHIIETLTLEEMGHIESTLMPPVVVIKNRRPRTALRLYERDNMVVLVSEIPIPLQMMYPLAGGLGDWFEKVSPSRVLVLGGVPVQNRMEIEKPGVWGVASKEADQEILEKAGVKLFEDGFLAGVNSLILLEGAKRDIPVTYLMGESHHGYPDPASAASTVEAVGRILGISIDVQKLLDTAEEIRVAARDLMKKTEEAMKASTSQADTEVPVMFG